MSYTPFDASKPNPANTRTSDINAIRTNECALRDAIIWGAIPGYDYSYVAGTGTDDEPQYYYFKNGNTWIRLINTWSGDKITVMVGELSIDGGSNYETIKTLTITFDAYDRVTAAVWS
jgi:hypothetical protein